MEGMTKAQVDKAESKDFALGGKPMRPRDAATLLLLDRAGGTVKVLMGRRHQRHAFMPGKFVFPGGRTDPADSRIAVAEHRRRSRAIAASRRGKPRDRCPRPGHRHVRRARDLRGSRPADRPQGRFLDQQARLERL
jgi:hypothetical protein